MTLKSLFRKGSSRRLMTAIPTQLTSTKPTILTNTTLALHIPEILYIIFSSFNQYTLTRTVRYVCKQWWAMARQFIIIRICWEHKLNTPYDFDFLLGHLDQVSELRVSFYWPHEADYEKQRWGELLHKVESLHNMNQLRITKVIFNNVSRYRLMVYPLLSHLVNLTDISLVVIDQSRVHLSFILALCPLLRSLSIDQGNWGSYSEIVEDPMPPGYESTVFKHSGIESLIIRGLLIRHDRLEVALKKCPQLQTLKLLQVVRSSQGVSPFNRTRFFAAIVASCPLLQLFHLSILGEPSVQADTLAMVHTFVHGAQPMQPEDEHQQLQAQCHKSNIDTISVMDRDIYMETSNALFAPFLSTSFNQTITNLEILPSVGLTPSRYISYALHDFLCSAPSLLSLVATSIPYFVENLDFTRYTGSEGFYFPFSRKARQSIKKIWACRRLRRLHIKFAPKEGTEEASAENARIMFGYIANVCPELRDLEIDRLALNLKLEGGFCLLTKLKSLQRLKILTWARTDLKRQDIEWMSPYPLENVILESDGRQARNPRSVVNFLVQRPKKTGFDKSGRPLHEIQAKDLKTLCSISKLKEFQMQLEQGGEDCMGRWPLLDFLGICLSLEHDGEIVDPEQYLPDMISKLRPGLEFSCNFSTWD